MVVTIVTIGSGYLIESLSGAVGWCIVEVHDSPRTHYPVLTSAFCSHKPKTTPTHAGCELATPTHAYSHLLLRDWEKSFQQDDPSDSVPP